MANDNLYLTAAVCTWPEPWQTWAGGPYPSRPATGVAMPSNGWRCPGCTRCFSPSVRECPFCQPEPQVSTTIGTSRRLGPADPMTEDDYER